MIKKNQKIIALCAMMLLSAGLFAQESNRSQSSAGQFGTEVDNFLSTTDFGSVFDGTPDGGASKSFFVYTRLGRGTLNGNLELGAAAKTGGKLSIGAFYNGWVHFDKAQSKSYSFDVYKAGKPDESRTWTAENRNGKPLTIGALVGIGDLGIKALYEDELKITGTGDNTTGKIENIYDGYIKPSVEVGGFKGPFKQARLSINFVRDEMITQTMPSGKPSHSGSSVRDSSGNAITSGLKNAVESAAAPGKIGSYVEPELYVSLGFGDFSLENSLAMRFYTNSAAKVSDAKTHDSDVVGLAYWNTSWDPDSDPGSSMSAVWDNKFFLKDIITPGYGLGGDVTDKLSWKVKAEVPVALGIDSNKYSAKIATGSASAEAADFANSSAFIVGITPALKAGVSFKPASVIDLHAGVQVDILNWQLAANSRKKVLDSGDNPLDKISGDAALKSQVQSLISSEGGFTQADDSWSTSDFTGPGMALGAGVTVYLGPAALDFILLKNAKPTVDGMFYEAISGGLNAALVLSATF
jgi:hypothetical protein